MTGKKTTGDIIIEYLTSNGYDGLTTLEGDCTCAIEPRPEERKLFACFNIGKSCIPIKLEGGCSHCSRGMRTVKR